MGWRCSWGLYGTVHGAPQSADPVVVILIRTPQGTALRAPAIIEKYGDAGGILLSDNLVIRTVVGGLGSMVSSG